MARLGIKEAAEVAELLEPFSKGADDTEPAAVSRWQVASVADVEVLSSIMKRALTEDLEGTYEIFVVARGPKESSR